MEKKKRKEKQRSKKLMVAWRNAFLRRGRMVICHVSVDGLCVPVLLRHGINDPREILSRLHVVYVHQL